MMNASAPSQIRKSGRIEELLHKVEALNERLAEALGGLTAIRVRLIGSSPENPENGDPVPTMFGDIGALGEKIENQTRLISEIQKVIGVLETL